MFSLAEILESAKLPIPERELPPVYIGGPVELESAFILYSSGYSTEYQLQVSPTVFLSRETKVLEDIKHQYIMQWAGALIQKPHRELSLHRGISPKGVYVSFVFHGGPANRSGLSALSRIIEINGKPIENLDAFKMVADALKHEKYLNITVLDLFNRHSVISLKQNNHYWPTRIISMP
jgi:hypothetical protein